MKYIKATIQIKKNSSMKLHSIEEREVGLLYTNKERALLQSKIRSCLRPDW